MDNNLDLIFKISTINSKIIKNIDSQLSIHGITYSEFLVMHQLSLIAAKTMRRIDLADKVGMSASGITRLLNPMEKIKIVKKEINARDARVSFVKITTAGEELYNNALKSVELCSKEFFEDLNNNDIVKFLEILKKIR